MYYAAFYYTDTLIFEVKPACISDELNSSNKQLKRLLKLKKLPEESFIVNTKKPRTEFKSKNRKLQILY